MRIPRAFASRNALLAHALSAAALVGPLAPLACGGGGAPKPPAVETGAAKDGGATATGSGTARTSPPPSGLPPMAEMPPPGVVGSKKARRRTDGALYACGAGAKPTAKDPADLVKRTGESCAAATKMKAIGGILRGQASEKDRHQEHKVRVEANKCYRVYFATDEGIRDAVVVVRDSTGDVVGESPALAFPEDGAFCFTSADEVSLLVSIGSGKGAYALSFWGE